MKKLLLYSFFIIISLSTLSTSANKIDDLNAFYKHVSALVKYPNEAKLKLIQGKNMVSFTIANGKIGKITVEHPLSTECDAEVVKVLLSYPNYKLMKAGNYALKTTFKLDGAVSPMLNNDIKAAKSYMPLEVTIVGFAPTNVKGSLKGKIDSVNVKGFNLKWRGTNGGLSGNEPLVVLNEVVVEYGGLAQINSDNIKEIVVLKDASATAAYGERGLNGVILVTTKDYVNKKASATLKLDGKTDSIKVKGYGIKLKGTQGWNAKNILVVLDDVIVEDFDMADIDPEDIKEVSVLKDASAVATYGEKAINGAIVITSKAYALKKSKK